MTTRESLHGLLDRLPEDLLAAAELSLSRLESWKDDPFWIRLLDAEEDPEPLTDEEAARVDSAWERLRSGDFATDAEVDRLLET